jgi:hypothetical protein
MVIDYKLFQSGRALVANTFVVGEQGLSQERNKIFYDFFVTFVCFSAPGLYVFQDQSSYLSANGYWGSYNVPFYTRKICCFFFVGFNLEIEIWSYSGYAPMYAKYGNAYSWSMCARAQIYRRDQHNVQTVQDLQKIQRYNKWQVDSLSLGDSCRGISARCDLNSPATNNTLNGYSAFGAIDGKGEEKTHKRKIFFLQTNKCVQSLIMF